MLGVRLVQFGSLKISDEDVGPAGNEPEFCRTHQVSRVAWAARATPMLPHTKGLNHGSDQPPYRSERSAEPPPTRSPSVLS